jgi:triosephosphate isomerase
MKEEWPSLVINFKQHIVGKKVREYVQRAEEIASLYQQAIIVCPSATDLHLAVQVPRKYLQVFGQSYDSAKVGESRTGAISPYSLKDAGVEGSLLNHFEKRIYGRKAGKEGILRNTEEDFQRLMELLRMGKELELKLLVCADTLESLKRIAQEIGFQEWSGIALALEVDEFIGSEKSVIGLLPDELRTGAAAIKKINPLIHFYCGGGIRGEEVGNAIKSLGVQGALIATYCTKAPEFEGDYRQAIEMILKSIN